MLENFVREGCNDDTFPHFVSHRSIKAALRSSGHTAIGSVGSSGYTRSFCALLPPGH
ncbi:hypothetical protein DDB_G0285625 [Dictyostelium discoideum AX4]|uniref:Uncharacterized protein n=1 Tax=Dictyostelium discoideum TaxID=44689 RepID=Q54MX0_DICDI|nr:hypothetical protein DDB_G0285625 [Dictyostelium discoideum AX4]EAL64650.1 hypothetical protein DDB_G0285625 [Dictyostelium discoideum AX4]|eukprot:XP_638173.1 hypothetical protein DDB_G0285625 [Dictyostelium discoideum AX4]